MDPNERQNNTMDDREANEANRVSDGTSEELQAIGGAQDQPSNNESAEQRSQLHDAICPLCGNEVDTKKTQSEFAENAASPGVNTSCDGALHLAFVNGMICVANTPESQPQEGENTIRAVERDVKKIPVQNESVQSVQVPCTPEQLSFFVLMHDYPPTSEMGLSLHFVQQSQKGRVFSLIRQMERQQGIKPQPVSFGDEYSSQQETGYVHDICLEDSVTVKFQLLKQMHRKFRIRDAQESHNVPLHRIISFCHHRIPGAIAQVRVVALCERDEVCQDHIRMTLEYGQKIRKMLIPIWSSGQDN